MHTRQGVAVPALSEHSVARCESTDNYIHDADRRAEIHRALWQEEELTWWQRLVLSPEPEEVHV